MNFENFLIDSKSTISDALKKIEKNSKGFILVYDKNKSIIGIATDGDIRRALIKKLKINDFITSCVNKNFLFERADSPKELLLKKLDNDIKFIPILDLKNKLLNIVTKDNIPLKQEQKVYARSKSPVRISFGGGGSDTSSFFKSNKGAVINSTISIYTHTLLKLRLDKKIIINSNDLNDCIDFKDFNALSSYDGKFNLIKAIVMVIQPSFGFELFIDSDFPMNSGLGGSAVVTSSILGCFNQFRSDKWDQYDISELAFQSERLHMGIAGGWQDQYATVFGGLNFMEFSNRQNLINPIRLSKNVSLQLEESLILCYTGTNHDSGDIHNDQKEQTTHDEVKKRIKKNVDLTYKMRELLLKGKLNEFGKCLHKAWELKRSFSSKISNKYLNDIYDGAIKNGAIGGKLLGAGGGGYFLFYTSSSSRLKLIKWIKDYGLEYTRFVFDDKGLQSWTVREKN